MSPDRREKDRARKRVANMPADKLEAHRAARRAYRARREALFPGIHAEQQRRYEQANPEKVKANQRKHRAKLADRNPEYRKRLARRKYLKRVANKAALGERIFAAATKAAPRGLPRDVRDDVVMMLVEGIYAGRFPIRLTPANVKEAVNRHYRQFSKFDTVSLDAAIGEDGFTRGHAMGLF